MKINRISTKRNVFIKSKPRIRKSSFLWKYKFHVFAAVILLAIAGLVYLYLSNKQIQLKYRISKLKQEEFRLQELNRKLRLEICVLKSPQRLEKIAKKRFGLKHPDPDQIIRLK